MDPNNDHYSTTLSSIYSTEHLCQIARPLIRAKARRLSGTAGFTVSDQDDIEQEVHLRLIERFEAARGNSRLPVLAFIKRVVNQSIANQLRDRFAHKRDFQRSSSLDRRGSTEGRALAGSLEQPPDTEARGPYLEMALDVEEVIEQLDADQQELCRLLKIESISDLARRFNRARSTVQDKVNQLRPAFEKGEVDLYVDKLRQPEPLTHERTG